MEECLYLFDRKEREKEEWYRRFVDEISKKN
jgi:hypothetical protein